tara:strand:+ start:77 stop:586 length:510 start_codon:yes stop_codon:yes gene_type:complete
MKSDIFFQKERAMNFKTIEKAVIWVVGFLAVSAFIGQVTSANMEWYDTLPKSPLNPPKWAFPIAWTSLYILLAIAASRFWMQRNDPYGKNHLTLFVIYMLFNWAWSFIFFTGHLVTPGFIWIVISDIILTTLIIILWRHDRRIETALIIPTLLWSFFAAYLNGYIAFNL